MRILDKSPKVSRRTFLKGGGLAAVGVTVLPTTTLLLNPREALAQSFEALGPDVGKTLLQMARDIFPHDKLSDTYYMKALEPYDKAIANDEKLKLAAGEPEKLKQLLIDGVRQLDVEARARFGKQYVAIPTEADRVTVLKALEETPFFQKIRGDLVTGLYNNKAVWPEFGYEGSSWEKGGYAKRGFNDLDWL